MIRHTSLREVVGTDFLRTVAGSYLTAAQLSFLVVALLLFQIIQLCTQHLQRLVFIFQLALFILAGNHDSGRDVGQTYRRVRRVDALTAVSGCTEYIEFTVVHIDLHVEILYLRHNRNRDRRGVDSAAALRLRHTLHTMHTALIFEPRIRTLTGNHEADIFHAADADFFHVHRLHPPTLTLCIAHIHPINFRCKQRRLVAARTRTDFHDNVFLIVGVLGKQQDFQLLLQLRNTGLCAV